jgi:hypothetical protein
MRDNLREEVRIAMSMAATAVDYGTKGLNRTATSASRTVRVISFSK